IPVEKPVEPDAAQVEIIAENTESLPEQPYVRSKVRRYSESSTTEGFGIVYFVEEGGERDTIRLLIPNQRISVTQTPAVETPVSRAPDTTTARPQPQFLEISSDTTQDRPLPVVVAPKRPGRSDCKVLAGENDFLRLRKAMAGKFTEEGMINEARKSFRNRCFTTEQVRNLSALFLTASGKYQFFDAAYNFVSDQDQFRNLQSEIMDDYYLNRFKALVGE
ncbi:MAG TPA: hypothetical protein VFZ78_01410, partial [Flavisolibacter sp.]